MLFRRLIVDAVAREGYTLKSASEKVGKNHAYLQQYVVRHVPENLPEDVRERLGKLLKLHPNKLRGKGPARAGHTTQHSGESSDERTVDADGRTVNIHEFDVRAPSGAGGSQVEITVQNAAEEAVAIYGFPSDGFRQVYGAPPESVRILAVVGDSMAPTLFPGQKIMVDINDRKPSPPGIFVVFDGIGLVLKRIEVIPGSDPHMVRIMSDNARYQPYERTIEEAHINGRVIGAWTRM